MYRYLHATNCGDEGNFNYLTVPPYYAPSVGNAGSSRILASKLLSKLSFALNCLLIMVRIVIVNSISALLLKLGFTQVKDQLQAVLLAKQTDCRYHLPDYYLDLMNPRP
jgi:hypothetical protein